MTEAREGQLMIRSPITNKPQEHGWGNGPHFRELTLKIHGITKLLTGEKQWFPSFLPSMRQKTGVYLIPGLSRVLARTKNWTQTMQMPVWAFKQLLWPVRPPIPVWGGLVWVQLGAGVQGLLLLEMGSRSTSWHLNLSAECEETYPISTALMSLALGREPFWHCLLQLPAHFSYLLTDSGPRLWF